MQWITGKPFVPPALLDRLGRRWATWRYAAHRWTVRPGPGRLLLLETGELFDVIEVPAATGLRALGAARLRSDVLGPDISDARGPVAVGPSGRWMFFVRPGLPLRPELALRLDVVRHGRGSQVPAAPTRLPEGKIRWAVHPGKVHWRPADPVAVQALLVEAGEAAGRHPARRRTTRPETRHPVPRQISTSRRAL